MRKFAEIIARAARRKGGTDALMSMLVPPRTAADIAATPDDRFLAEMTRAVFQAGFDWSLINKKWPGFEEAFEGFVVDRWVLMSDDDADRLAKDRRIVGNMAKIRSVGVNAQFLNRLAMAHGSAAAFFAASPPRQYFELLQRLKAEGSRLGGKTGQLFLRRMGVDSLIFSEAVLAALKQEGVTAKMPTSRRDIEAVEKAVAGWHAETGLPLTAISQILAFSVEA